jgi:hypothetical protein
VARSRHEHGKPGGATVTISVVNVHAHIAPHGMWSVILKNASALQRLLSAFQNIASAGAGNVGLWHTASSSDAAMSASLSLRTQALRRD